MRKNVHLKVGSLVLDVAVDGVCEVFFVSVMIVVGPEACFGLFVEEEGSAVHVSEDIENVSRVIGVLGEDVQQGDDFF